MTTRDKNSDTTEKILADAEVILSNHCEKYAINAQARINLERLSKIRQIKTSSSLLAYIILELAKPNVDIVKMYLVSMIFAGGPFGPQEITITKVTRKKSVVFPDEYVDLIWHYTETNKEEFKNHLWYSEPSSLIGGELPFRGIFTSKENADIFFKYSRQVYENHAEEYWKKETGAMEAMDEIFERKKELR